MVLVKFNASFCSSLLGNWFAVQDILFMHKCRMYFISSDLLHDHITLAGNVTELSLLFLLGFPVLRIVLDCWWQKSFRHSVLSVYLVVFSDTEFLFLFQLITIRLSIFVVHYASFYDLQYSETHVGKEGTWTYCRYYWSLQIETQISWRH